MKQPQATYVYGKDREKHISLGGGAVVGATVKWAASEELLMAPFEKMAATSTSYSALGFRSCSVTLVVPEMFTVV